MPYRAVSGGAAVAWLVVSLVGAQMLRRRAAFGVQQTTGDLVRLRASLFWLRGLAARRARLADVAHPVAGARVLLFEVVPEKLPLLAACLWTSRCRPMAFAHQIVREQRHRPLADLLLRRAAALALAWQIVGSGRSRCFFRVVPVVYEF